ncbi:VOC family protein [Pseudooceanicola sp. LIPI14-2-Ac024]|uniref:VOC family protein n=1 Tax=Pseudooceanicola sp. LIPI14-2-Ac024 TaxID=3344875 RepID=UPI0035D115D0
MTTAYQQMIFLNIPVTDLPRSRAFYAALGFTFDDRFCDDTAACVVVSDTITLMLLTHEKFASFSPRPIADPATTAQHLICLSRDSAAAVDTIMDKAVTAGGIDNDKVIEMGDYMYGRSFSDPDGHVFEMMWMDVDKAMADWGQQAETA